MVQWSYKGFGEFFNWIDRTNGLNSVWFQQTIAHVDSAVSDSSQSFVVCDDDECLSIFVSLIEEQLM